MPVEVSARALSVRPFSERWKLLDMKASLIETLESPFVRWEVKSADYALFATEAGGLEAVLLIVSPKVEIIRNAETPTAYTGTFSDVKADFCLLAFDFSIADKDTIIAWLWKSIAEEKATSRKAASSVRTGKRKYRARIRKEARSCQQQPTPT